MTSKVEMTCCVVHPHVALPVASREAERFLCYECTQSERRRKYKEQRDEWDKQQKLGFRQRHPSFAITEGFTVELVDAAKRIIEARKQRHLQSELQGTDL